MSSNTHQHPVVTLHPVKISTTAKKNRRQRHFQLSSCRAGYHTCASRTQNSLERLKLWKTFLLLQLECRAFTFICDVNESESERWNWSKDVTRRCAPRGVCLLLMKFLSNFSLSKWFQMRLAGNFDEIWRIFSINWRFLIKKINKSKAFSSN